MIAISKKWCYSIRNNGGATASLIGGGFLMNTLSHVIEGKKP